MATDDDDAATLRERVRELEQTVAQQQDTIQQLLPSRRAVLAGGAGLVGGAALTGQASAQSAAGQVGTSSEPVDVEAATVTATDVTTDSVKTREPSSEIGTVANIGDSGRIDVGSGVELADEETILLVGSTAAGNGARLQIRNADDFDAAAISTAGNSVSLDASTGPWAASDSDGNNCVFLGGSGIVLKNRTGGPKTYNILKIRVF